MRLGTLFGRAAAGAGAAVAGLANKYIDEEIAANKAQTLANIQLDMERRRREDEDAFKNDPTRVARDRNTAREGALFTEATNRTIALNRANDTELQGASESAADRAARAATARGIEAKKTELGDATLNTMTRDKTQADALASAETERKKAIAAVSDPEYMKALPALKLADPEVKARIDQARAAAASSYASAQASRNHGEVYKAQADAAKQTLDLTNEMLRTIDDPNLSPDARKSKLETLSAKMAVLNPPKKEGGGATTETVTEYGPDGKPMSKKETVKQPGVPVSPEDRQAAQIKAGIEKARADGKIGQALAELKARGMTREAMAQFGATPDEISAAFNKPRSGGGSLMDRATAAPTDPISSAHNRVLERIAATEGHTMQQAAKAELERRRAEAAEVDTTGFGFGTP